MDGEPDAVGLLTTVLSGFALAAAAPGITRLLGRWSGWAIALLPLAIAAYLATNAGAIAEPGSRIREAYPWAPDLGLTFSFVLDGLSLLFAILVSGIGALIFIYAGGYLKGHPQLGRLYAYLLMFMGSMLGLVLADNLITLFIFWELTSISSYLLIGFDHSVQKSRKSALQALLTTGLGGLALLAGALLLGMIGGTYEISELLSAGGDVRRHDLYTPIVLLVVFAAFTKSAQFPFHFWLPNAMAAPTPVSAYLHSSTMVKAGIYLLARLDPVLGFEPGVAATQLWTWLLVIAGAATMFIGAWLAFRQTVMKPLLAYTTISALGTIVMGLGIGTDGAVEAALVFLLSHAFYKGALFMVAGTLDHETGEKDAAKLGGLRRRMPILCAAAGLAAVSMAGFPPLIGFIGKELALKALLPQPGYGGWLSGLFTASAAFTVAAAITIGIRPFIGALRPTPVDPHEAPPSLLVGPVALAGLGLLSALLPMHLAYPLIAPAASAVLGSPATPKIELWHGLNLALLLSGVATVAGVMLFVIRPMLTRALRWLEPIEDAGPARIYEVLLAGTLALATGQTRVLQTGYLRFYLFVILGTAVGLVGAAMVTRGMVGGLRITVGEVSLSEIGLVALILLGAIVAATAKTRLAAVAALGLVGYGVSLVYILFGAPDLAMTQIAIETLTVILFMLVFYHLPDFRSLSSPGSKLRDLLIALSGGAMMTGLVLMVTRLTPNREVSQFFSEQSYPGGHGRNVVNVILVDFRAMDTLGEIVVLAVAGIGVWALLRLSPKEAKPAEPKDRIGEEGTP